MSVVKEMMVTAAGLIFTVALVTMSLGVYKKAEMFGRTIVADEEERLSEAYEYELNRYDDADIDGSRVISYIKKMYGLSDVTISVTNENTTFTVDHDSIGGIRDTGSVYYINPMRKYSVDAGRDDNKTVKEIIIKEKRG